MGTGSLAILLNLQRLDPDAYGEIKIHPANDALIARVIVAPLGRLQATA